MLGIIAHGEEEAGHGDAETVTPGAVLIHIHGTGCTPVAERIVVTF